ncbi:hypothetical protein Tco_0841031 [Tanacetum coccineum]|uniref:Uncharacterized protein n=1 Tax=Tanacetum coccineum TaxID=301880 RepID=A0ABQ5AZM9_9ASTR
MFAKKMKGFLKKDKILRADLKGPTFELLKNWFGNIVELEYNSEHKPLPLEGPPGRKTIPTRYFFNNDLKYLNPGNTKKKYVLSLSKCEEDRGRKKFGYGYLKEIVINRADQKEYMFIEYDFSCLNLNNIEDMYLLWVQGKIHHLDGVNEFDLINALLLYIRRIVIKKRVEDVHLGTESYQTKLKLTKPQLFKGEIQYTHPYTTMSDPIRVVYLNKDKQRTLMRFDETHKFSDGTLNQICKKLKVMLTDNVMGFDNVNLDRCE